MSYIRHGHQLRWFNDVSSEYVYPCSKGAIEDYNTNYEHLPSFVELIGNIVMVETQDFDYATKIVVHLARALGIDQKLRRTDFQKDWVDKLMMRSGRDYEGCIRKYLIQTTPIGVDHFEDDDISDFDYLPTYEDHELYDVEKHMDTILCDIESTVKKITEELDMPPKFTVESGNYRWESVCDADYEIGAVVKVEDTSVDSEGFVVDEDTRDQKLQLLEDSIKDHPLFKGLESKYGEVSIMVYIPFDIEQLRDKSNDTK